MTEVSCIYLEHLVYVCVLTIVLFWVGFVVVVVIGVSFEFMYLVFQHLVYSFCLKFVLSCFVIP